MSDQAFPILGVADLPAVCAFYERLGFVRAYQFPPDGPPEFVTLERGTSALGVGADGGTDTTSFAYWVYVDDVDATVEGLRTAGAVVIDEPTDRPWGERVATLEDPAGNRVHVGAEISSPPTGASGTG